MATIARITKTTLAASKKYLDKGLMVKVIDSVQNDRYFIIEVDGDVYIVQADKLEFITTDEQLTMEDIW